MFCFQCGVENKDDARFCGKCGAPLKADDFADAGDSVIDVNGADSHPLAGADERGSGDVSVDAIGAAKASDDAARADAPSANYGSFSGGAGSSGGEPPSPSEPPKGKKGRWIAAAIAAAVVVVAAVVFVAVGGPSALMSQGDDVKINPAVVVYDEEGSGFEILASDASSITVSSLKGISETSIIAAGVTDVTPSGLLRAITSIEQNDDGTYTLHTRQAALTEAIEECDVSATLTFGEEGIAHATQETRPVSGVEQANADSLIPVIHRFSFDISTDDFSSATFSFEDTAPVTDRGGDDNRKDESGEKKDESAGEEHGDAAQKNEGENQESETDKQKDEAAAQKDEGDAQEGGDDAPELDVGIHGSVGMGYGADADLKIKDGKVDMSFLFGGYLDALIGVNSASVSASYDLNEIEALKNVLDKITNVEWTVMVGPVPVVFVLEVSPALDFGVSWDGGYGQLTATLDKTAGFTYRTGEGLQGVHEDRSFAPAFEMGFTDDACKIAGTVEPNVGMFVKLYGMAGPEVGIGVASEVSAGIVPVEGDGNAPRLPGSDTPFAGDVAAQVSVPISGSFKVETPEFVGNIFDTTDEELADVPLFDTDDLITLWEYDQSYPLPSFTGPGSSEAPESAKPSEQAEGVTGTVVVTTYEDRAEAVDFPTQDFDGDRTQLVLFVLDTPQELASRYGDGTPGLAVGLVSTMRLPDSFAAFDGQRITLAADVWGYTPTDVAGVLYGIDLLHEQTLRTL